MVLDNNKSIVGESEIYLGENGIVRIKIGQTINENESVALLEKFRDLTKTQTTKPRILIDITLAVASPRSFFRKRTAEILREAFKNPGFEKTALFGEIDTLRMVITSFVIKATGLENVKFFKTEEEALKWLKED